MNIKNIIISIFLTITCFALYALLLNVFIEDKQVQGQFGDMFGTLNAFFSGLAFIGLTYSLLQQNNILAQNATQIKQNTLEFETQQKIIALTTLINIYQSRLADNAEHLKINELKQKMDRLTLELEQFLTKK